MAGSSRVEDDLLALAVVVANDLEMIEKVQVHALQRPREQLEAVSGECPPLAPR